MKSDIKIILATTSPYRKEAFEYLGIEFTTLGSNVDESQAERNDPEKLVALLAQWKAEAVAQNNLNAIVIGMDSVGFFAGMILEKPKSREEAFQRLKNLSGKSHQFYTGIHIINTVTGKASAKVVKTNIRMRDYADWEIEKYLDQDSKYFTYALGYDPERHYSATFPRQIEGSYNNFLRGIPLEDVVEMLIKMNVMNDVVTHAQIHIDYNPSPKDHFFISVHLNNKECISFDKTIKGHRVIKQVYKEYKAFPENATLNSEWNTIVIENGNFVREYHVQWIDQDKLDWLNGEIWETVWERPISLESTEKLLHYSQLISDNYKDLTKYHEEVVMFEKMLAREIIDYA